jgi:hypothetical protein
MLDTVLTVATWVVVTLVGLMVLFTLYDTVLVFLKGEG